MYVNDAMTARSVRRNSYLAEWFVTWIKTLGSASLIPTSSTLLFILSAFPSSSASNFPQMMSSFTMKPNDSYVELHRRSRHRLFSENNYTGRSSCPRPPYTCVSSSQASQPSALPPCSHLVAIVTADLFVACARRNHRNCVQHTRAL